MSEVGTAVLTDGQLQAERYVASNRFRLQGGKGPTFEKRWAERKSRLANLDGFRFFTLMRRVEGMGGPPKPADAEEEYDYVSLTIWEDKSGFDAWRTGEAFKEAHGGGTIFGFAEMLISSIMVLKGGPKPAFYDGLLPVVKPPDEGAPWRAVGGWRDVPADGVNPLDTDVYVAMNRFTVLPGKEEAFERRWAERESKLENMDGFLTFLLLRRDALKAEDGYNYSTLTVWRSKEDFQAWREIVRQLRGALQGCRGGAHVRRPAQPGHVRRRPRAAQRERRLTLTSFINLAPLSFSIKCEQNVFPNKWNPSLGYSHTRRPFTKCAGQILKDDRRERWTAGPFEDEDRVGVIGTTRTRGCPRSWRISHTYVAERYGACPDGPNPAHRPRVAVEPPR
jgi:heme-degrading monooxygenase HmoA